MVNLTLQILSSHTKMYGSFFYFAYKLIELNNVQLFKTKNKNYKINNIVLIQNKIMFFYM